MHFAPGVKLVLHVREQLGLYPSLTKLIKRPGLQLPFFKTFSMFTQFNLANVMHSF